MMEYTKSRQLLWDFLLNNQMVLGVTHMGIDWPFCGIKSDFSYSEKKFSVHFGDNRNGPPYDIEMKMKNSSPLFWNIIPDNKMANQIIFKNLKKSYLTPLEVPKIRL